MEDHLGSQAQGQVVAHVERHRDGGIRARGQTVEGFATGYWEFFRRDGTMLRSGHYDRGRQVGEWTTYDKAGKPYKATTIRPDKSDVTRFDR